MTGGPHAADASFVGRDAELTTLRGFLEGAAEGTSSAVLLSGEAGVGKTTLMERVLTEAPDGALVLRGGGLPLESLASPFLALRSALRDLPAGVPEPPLQEGVATRGIDPVTFDAWLDDVSVDRLVLLAVDDVHWVDRSTLDVLLYVLAANRSRSVLVLLTLRSEEVGEGHPLHRWLADVRRLPGFVDLELGTLDRYWTGRQIAAVIGGMPHESLVEDVYRSSHGNPYLTKLLVTGLDPTARSIPTDLPTNLGDAVLASWHGLSPGSRGLATVLAVAGRPMSRSDITELVAGRLDTSSVPEQLWEARDHALLDVDREGRYWFHHPLQAEVLEAQLHPEDRREWHEVAAKLLESRLENAGHGVPDVARVVAIADHYSAAGLTDDAYRWSLRVADEAPTVSSSDVVRALERALNLHASVDVSVETRIDLLWRLRRVTAQSGDLEAELRTVEDLLAEIDREREPAAVAELLVRRIHLLDLTRKRMYRVDDAEEAVRVARERPGTWQLALALAQLSHAWAWSFGGEDTVDRAVATADEALTVARATSDHLALSHALAARAFAALLDDQVAHARELAAEAHQEAGLSGDYWALLMSTIVEANSMGSRRDMGVRDLWMERLSEMERLRAPHSWVATLAQYVARSALDVGDVETARRMIRFALGANPGPLAEVGTRVVAARLAVLTGAVTEARQHQARAGELASEALSDWGIWAGDVVQAMIFLASGDPGSAFERCRARMRMGAEHVHMGEWLLPLAAAALADLAGAEDSATGARADVASQVSCLEREYPPTSLDGGLSSSIPTTESLSNADYRIQVVAFDAWYAAELARAKRASDAAEMWERAAAGLDEAGLPWEAAYAWMRLGEAYLLAGRPDRKAATAALRGAVQRATPLEARPVLEKVEALARTARIDVSLVGRPPENGHLPGLTRREREILEHLVAGRTYSEIAEALYVSEKTVSSHISNMLRKTGTSNRHELAARALASRR